MRIAQLSPLFESVPPQLYGGTERVVSWLTEELVRRGHEVVLFASGDSSTAADLVPVVGRALRLGEGMDAIRAHMLQIGMVQRRAGEFDVIHSHIDLLGFPAFRRGDPPLLTTMHGRLDLPGMPDLLRVFQRHALASISDAQRAPAPQANWAGTVYHGLPLDEFPFAPVGGDFLVFLGRMSPEKRPDVAIRLARRAGVRLVLAAKVDRADREYFESVVRPLLSEPGIEFIGEVDERGKVALLREARALLFPILWPEPFGLAMIEALACGAPVLTRRCGSTAEVIDDGVSGFVCDDDESLLAAIGRIDEIDRRACRAAVETRFSAARMARDYECIYRHLQTSRRSARMRAASQSLSPWKPVQSLVRTASVTTPGA